MSLPDVNWPLLTRYLSGDASAAEQREIESWRDARRENAAFLVELSARWGTVSAAAAPHDSEAQWRALQASLGMVADAVPSDVRVAPIRPSRIHSPRWALPRARSLRPVWRWMSVFALGAAAAAVAVVSFNHRPARHTAIPETARTYRTEIGQTATVTMAEHRITLAPQTTLIIEGSNAYLTGEALFEHDSATTSGLVVHARNARIREIGTVFNVRAYAEDHDVRIAVREGKVSVGTSDARGTLLLSAQDVGRVSANGEVATVAVVNADSLMAWRTGSLVFESAPLATIAAQLTRWYGLTFAIPDAAVGQMRLTITFRTTDSRDAVVSAIALVTGTDARRHGNVVTIMRAKNAR